MNTIQNQLCPIDQTKGPIRDFDARLTTWLSQLTVHQEFVDQLRTAVGFSWGRRLIAVGCSPAFETMPFIQEVLSVKDGGGEGWAAEHGILELSVPPPVSGQRQQIKQLHARIRGKAGLVYAKSRHPEQYRLTSVWNWPTDSDTEALIGSLQRLGVRVVFMREAENLHPIHRNLRDVGALWHHVADVAEQSRVPHVVFGSPATIWRAANSRALGPKIEVLMQRFYVPDQKADRLAFCKLLKTLDRDLGDAADLALGLRVNTLMPRVGGDIYRMVEWLRNAMHEANRLRASVVSFAHLASTTPPHVGADGAKDDALAYGQYLASRACDFPLLPSAATSSTTGLDDAPSPRLPFGSKPKPFQRSLDARDLAFTAA